MWPQSPRPLQGGGGIELWGPGSTSVSLGRSKLISVCPRVFVLAALPAEICLCPLVSWLAQVFTPSNLPFFHCCGDQNSILNL